MNRQMSLLLVLALLFGTSHLSKASRPTVDNKLANTEWQLKSFEVSGKESPVVEGTSVTLKFGADGRAGGSSGCNSYGAEHTEQADRLTFNRIVSTKRACLDNRANQQEAAYFSALQSATRFNLSDDRLTVFYGDSQNVLNFMREGKPPDQMNENVNGPVEMLALFYDAVNRRDYERAYRYWETPATSLEEFSRGYANTANVQLIVQPPIRVEGAAGSLYVEIPTVLVARQRDGSQRVFAGCYVARRSNIQTESSWRIYKASVSAVTNNTAVPKLLAETCKQ